MIICIDSHAIIWGIKGQATPGQEEMNERAEWLFQWADQNEHEIVIPTVVISEVLAPENPGARAFFLETMSKSFIIATFDTRAALKYAEILHGRLKEVVALANETGTVRQKMKIDHLIIATALVNGASVIYSYDDGLKKFAAGYIDVKEFPPLPPKQTTIFDF